MSRDTERVRTSGGLDRPMPDTTEEMRERPEFEAIWQVIKSWDVNVPEFYEGYCGANGSHVALILNALDALNTAPGRIPDA